MKVEFQEALSLFFRSVVVVGVPCDPMQWTGIDEVPSRSWLCGYCSKEVASNRGIIQGRVSGRGSRPPAVMICQGCEKPTFFPNSDDVCFVPTGAPGKADLLLPDDVAALYQEARTAAHVGLYTSTVTICRKLLAHSAVNQGAETGLNFYQYVEFLVDENIITRGMKDWVDVIRKVGNAATHEIDLVTEPDATRVLHFTGLLLTLVHDAPARLNLSPPESDSSE